MNLEKGEDRSEDELEPASEDAVDPASAPLFDPDVWYLNDDDLIIHHKKPSSKLYGPDEASCPIPLKYLAVMRKTFTDIEDKTEYEVETFGQKTEIGNYLTLG